MKKYILVLDLDETLLHTTDNDKTIMRPGLKSFIKEISKYMYLVLYTAALKVYADELLHYYDINKYFTLKLYRNSCITINNNYSKDLKIVIQKLLNQQLKNKNDIPKSLLIKNNKIHYNNIIFIDNLEENCILQPKNSIVIKDYIGQKNDKALYKLINFLKNLNRFSNNNAISYLKKNSHQIKKYIKN